MNIKLLIYNQNINKLYDMSELASDPSFSADIDGQPGKLEFTLEKNPEHFLGFHEKYAVVSGNRLIHPDILIENGNQVQLIIDSYGIFSGYIFKMTMGEKGNLKIIAYDHMRYLKNEHSVVLEEKTASQIFEKLCTDFKLRHYVNTPSPIIIEPEYYSKKTLYAIMESALEVTNRTLRGQHWYFIRDAFGTLLFTDVLEHKTDLILGTGSLLTEYDYEVSIDDDTYNQILVTQEDKEIGMLDKWIEFDSDTQKRWGILQKVVQADENATQPMLVQMADDYLQFFNRESRKMKLNAIGTERMGLPTRTTELVDLASTLNVGSGLKMRIDELGISQDVWISRITHNYQKDMHKIEMEVVLQ